MSDPKCALAESCECPLDVLKDLKEDLARYLIREKGYLPEDIQFDVPLVVEVAHKRLEVKIDLVVSVDGKPGMCIRCHPTSVVSRERGAMAAARLLYPEYVLPVAVQTNGIEYSILDCVHKKVIGHKREDLPSREELKKRLEKVVKLPPKRRPIEEKILYFYEGLG